MRKIVPPEFLNLINRKEGHSKLYEDRRMITDRSPWPVYDEGAMDFFHTFQSLLEGGRGLGEYLRLKLPSEVIGRAVGIELGGPGVQLFSDLQGIFAKTAGVDLSGKEYFAGAHHIPSQHSLIAGNIFKHSTVVSIDEWLHNPNTQQQDKINFLICRLEGGTGFMPNEYPQFMLQQLNKWYRRMADHGLMLMQLSPQMEFVPQGAPHGNTTSAWLVDYFDRTGLRERLSPDGVAVGMASPQHGREDYTILKIVKSKDVTSLMPPIHD